MYLPTSRWSGVGPSQNGLLTVCKTEHRVIGSLPYRDTIRTCVERVGETVVAVGTNDERFIILGENERSDRNCGDLVGKDREQMFNLSTVSKPCEASICLLVPLSVISMSDDDLCFILSARFSALRHQT